MKIATISQAKNQFSALIDRVRQGETILILDRDRPVARLEPAVSEGGTDPEGRLSRLERAGALRRGKGPALVARILKEPPPTGKKGSDILKALLEERELGR
jgi:prevent-host-death family protein